MRFIVLVLACSLAGCPDRTVDKVVTVPSGELQKDIAVSADIDILFVIDDSLSTTDKQTVFAQNFPKFVQALDAFPTGRPSVHIGVVSSSVDIGVDGFGGACHPAAGNNGMLHSELHGAACMPLGGAFISDLVEPDGTRQTNYTGTLKDELSCIAQLGDMGCGFEAQLEGMKRALDGSQPGNAGFIRNGAFLAVIILTDEDDCSVQDPTLFALGSAAAGPGDFRCQPLYAYNCDEPISPSAPGTYTNCKVRTGSYLRDPADYYTFLTSLKGADKVVVALIAGDPTTTIMTGPLGTQPLALLPSCSATINGDAAIGRPGIRLADFQQQFGDDGLFRTVCQPDYSAALTDIGKLLFEKVSPCLEGDIDTTDTDPHNPGTQLDCVVSDSVQPDGAMPMENDIYACDMADPMTPAPGGTRPCWWTSVDATTCTTATSLEIHIERTMPPATGTTTRVRCAAQ